MKRLKREQLIQLARRFHYDFEINKKANLLALRVEIEKVKTPEQNITVKYAEAIFDIFMSCRANRVVRDATAYFSGVSDDDLSNGRLPLFERESVYARADQSSKEPVISEIRPAADQAPVVSAQVHRKKADYTHLHAGHQTLLGAGNIIGVGISLVFIVFMISLAAVAIGSIFG